MAAVPVSFHRANPWKSSQAFFSTKPVGSIRSRLRDWRETATEVRVVGKDKLGSEDVWIVRVESEFEPPQTRYVSLKSGLLLKEESWITAKGLGTFPRSVACADYREVAGVQLPFRLTTESAVTGKQVMQFAEVRPNPVIDAATFSPPKE